MPNRLQIGMDAPLVGWALIAATLTAMADHLIGLVDVMAISVGVLWLLDMVGGVVRAWVTGKTMSWRKFLEGGAKVLVVGIVAISFGLVELAQAQVFDGGYIPLVAPLLGGAMVLFLWSILDQAGDIWPAFGAHAQKLLNEWENRRHPGREEEERDRDA